MIEIFHQHRPLLFGIAYRMLGRVTESEDLVQETWLRWQRQDLAEVRSAKSWLVATITRLSIDRLRSAAHEREHYYGVWLPEPFLDTAAPPPSDAAVLADSLAMAFMLILESMNPLQRAVFLLREVFEYDYPEIAEIVGKSDANCRQIVRRAKSQLRPNLPDATAGSSAITAQAQLVVEQFMHATRTGEVRDLLALLTDDAVMYSDGGGRVAAAGRPIRSADHISRFFVGVRDRLPADTELNLLSINGRPGAVRIAAGAIHSVLSFEFRGDRISTIYIVRNPEKLRHLPHRASVRTGVS